MTDDDRFNPIETAKQVVVYRGGWGFLMPNGHTVRVNRANDRAELNTREGGGFSTHALRHRRISLLHRQGVSWATIGERMGQRSKLVTADTYMHALIDSREVYRPP